MHNLSNLIKKFFKLNKKLNKISQFMHNLFVFLVIFDNSNICFINTPYKLILVNIFLFFCSWTHTELGIFFCFSALGPILSWEGSRL